MKRFKVAHYDAVIRKDGRVRVGCSFFTKDDISAIARTMKDNARRVISGDRVVKLCECGAVDPHLCIGENGVVMKHTLRRAIVAYKKLLKSKPTNKKAAQSARPEPKRI